MKLNVGCGHDYLTGYLNIDVSADSLADVIMEAHDLKIDNCAVDEIVAAQLIEHLGFFKGKYFLAECFRVLRPGGTLRLETPHLERSFEIFLAGDRSARESALTWLYGAEGAHMQHRFCFPLELLRELAAEIGFELLHHEAFLYQENRPALRLMLRKPDDGGRHQFMADLRKRLVARNIPAFDDELTMAGQEDLLKRLAASRSAAPADILPLAVFSAEIVREYLALRSEVDADAVQCRIVAARLAESRFQEVLLAVLKARREGGGEQRDAFHGTLREGSALISALLDGKKVKMPGGDGLQAVGLFSESVLKSLADKLFARGLKAFRQGEYLQALGFFDESRLIFRDNPFVWWNIARIHRLQGNAVVMRSNFSSALAALDASSTEVQRIHRDALMAEMNGDFSTEPLAAAVSAWAGSS